MRSCFIMVRDFDFKFDISIVIVYFPPPQQNYSWKSAYLL